ncbi:MAG: hypothetical protein O2897_03305 [bacterium]|nr:hypothetical protein [bacterium]
MKIFIVSLVLVYAGISSANFVQSENMSFESKICEKWVNGKCMQGPLTRLSDALKTGQIAKFSIEEDGEGEGEVEEEATTCNKVCEQACPKCDYCDYCSFCDFYQESACEGITYFTDKETCEAKKTNNCCDVCATQCEVKGGACADGGICKGGSSETSTLMYCIEKTRNEPCRACSKKAD